MSELLYRDESYNIIGACMEVHNELGCGFLESVYQEALEREFEIQGIPFKREMEIPLFYKGIQMSKNFRADFICYGSIILELKALDDICSEHIAQVINYLKATKIELGLLINFGAPSLQHKRVIRLKDKEKKSYSSF